MGLQACTGILEEGAWWGNNTCTLRTKACLGTKHFLRQSGPTGLRENAGRSVCVSTRSSLVLNVPSTWRGSKQGSGLCSCLRSPGRPGPGLVKTPSSLARGCSRHRAPKCGLRVTKKNYKGQFKYSLYFSLPLRFFLYFQKQ